MSNKTANNKTTKHALLSSVLAMLLSVIMLMGTTFAWFTDTAATGVNRVQAGTLDVALEMEESQGNWVSAEGVSLEFIDLDENDLWEPGCTYTLPKLRVVNKGNLALKFRIVITGIMGDAKLNEAIEWTIDGLELDTEYSLGPDEMSDPLSISGHMKETAGNEYQGLSIDGISITVVAAQDTVEFDSSGKDYDEDAEYPVIFVDDLKAAVAAGGYVSVGADITVPSEKLGGESGYGKSGISQTNGGVIDGNGNTISAQGANSTWDATIYTKGGTIKNAIITGGFRGIFIAQPTEDIIIDNVIINPGAYTIHSDSGGGKNLIVTNSTLNGWTSYAATLASATFTNCKFGSNGSYAYMRPYCKTTLTNCTFDAGFQMDARQTSEIILVNCTYDGELITQDNLVSLLGDNAAGATVNNN